MKQYKAYLIDLDGTTYLGKERIRSAETFIKKLLEKDIPFLFLTNNATANQAEVAKRLKDQCELIVSPDHVYTSALALVAYLDANHKGQSIHVVGEESLRNLIKDAGYTLDQSKNADVVVQALDRQVTYKELSNAVLAIRNGAEFLVTNTDSNLPSEEGMVPSSGALTAFISYATQKDPIVMGKPNAPILEGALKQLGVAKEDCLMIGDNYNTDILVGINNGVDTAMVLTGFTTREDLEDVDKQPTYVIENMLELPLD